MNDYPGSEDERIRRLLNDAVGDVEPRESLDSIRSRTMVTPFRARRPWILGAGAAVVATAATVAAVAVMGGNPGTTDARDPGFAGPSSATTSAEAPTASSPDPTSGESDEPAPSAETTVPVYYVGDTSRGPRLFREFHSVVTADPVLAAVEEAVSGDPVDTDYRSPWPDGAGAGSVSFDGEIITVNLEPADAGGPELGLHDRPPGMSEQEAAMAVEQVIYSAQAALQQGRPPVQLMINGQRTDMVLGVPASEPLAEGDALDVLAQVWIIDPAEGAEVTVPFEVSGLANAFEANVQWELMQGDTVVKEGFTMAEEAFTMAPYSFRVKDVPPGDYTLVVHDSDPSGGEGFAPWVDTKNITVVE